MLKFDEAYEIIEGLVTKGVYFNMEHSASRFSPANVKSVKLKMYIEAIGSQPALVEEATTWEEIILRVERYNQVAKLKAEHPIAELTDDSI